MDNNVHCGTDHEIDNVSETETVMNFKVLEFLSNNSGIRLFEASHLNLS